MAGIDRLGKSIAVVGTDANGGCVAADLVHAGPDVTVIDQWPEHAEDMRSNGLTVEMPGRRLHVDVSAHHLCDVCTFQRRLDYVFLMPKVYDSGWMAHLILPYLSENGIMVGIQNAMTAAEIAAIAGSDRTVACVIAFSSELFTPGLIQRNTPPEKSWLGIGVLDSVQQASLPELRDILLNVGRISIADDTLSAKRMKLVVNSMRLGPVAMLGLTPFEAVNTRGSRKFLLRAGRETLAVGQKLGHSVEPLFGLSAEEMKDTNRLLEMLIEKLAGDIGPTARDCVLQDHLKGRYSEVDFINGSVVAEGRGWALRRPRTAPSPPCRRALMPASSRRIPRTLNWRWNSPTNSLSGPARWRAPAPVVPIPFPAARSGYFPSPLRLLGRAR